jgi:hypothetical protein
VVVELLKPLDVDLVVDAEDAEPFEAGDQELIADAPVRDGGYEGGWVGRLASGSTSRYLNTDRDPCRASRAALGTVGRTCRPYARLCASGADTRLRGRDPLSRRDRSYMAATDLTQERIAKNQVSFREANERIEATAYRVELRERVPFICECSDPSCMELVRLDLDEYENVRQNPRRFCTVPGHATAAVAAGAAVIVGELNGYTLVDKIGVAGEIAEERYDEGI